MGDPFIALGGLAVIRLKKKRNTGFLVVTNPHFFRLDLAVYLIDSRFLLVSWLRR